MENQTHALPSHASFAVFDRRVDALPNKKCAIIIFNDGEWLPCEWNPRMPESQADAGYLGTATATSLIGFHAWEQNDSEFRYFCLLHDLATGSALPRDMVERAERYTDQFCSLTENTTGEASTRLHAAVLLHELRSVRRYCCALEEQLDGFGLRAAQRAAGFNEPNAKGDSNQ